MKKDKFRLYFLEILLLVILFSALLVLNKMTYTVLAIILFIYAIIVKSFLKKKKFLSINKGQVNLLMVGFGIIYLGFFYLIGLLINDFYKQPITFSFTTLYRFILPMATIIVSSEVIRFSFLSLDTKVRIFNKNVDISKIITFINMVLIDLIVYTGVYDLSNYNDFLTVVGFTLFASVSCNLFYNYVANRYGIKGIILYRMITVLYVYIIPIIPNIYLYFRAFLRMIYPYIMYIVLERTYSSSDFAVAYKDKRKNVIGITILIIIMVSITMLVSCKFKYGMLVIGSGSMTGTINYGDAVVFESYDDQQIQNGDIIIFERKGIRLVHRVVKIRNIDNEIRYYTKGDANEDMDSGYVSKEDIVGITKFRVVYIGYPTLWIRSLFK